VKRRRQKSTPRLIIYAKVPRSGQVKTRIAAEIGNGRAAEIYRAMLSGFLARLRGLRRRWHVEIHFTPADQEQLLVPEVPPGIQRIPQVEGDLGARLKHSFATAFQASRDPVVIIGTDSPDLPVKFLQEALDQLASHDVVVGPAKDGGYYLIGLRSPMPALFDGIPWSGPEVAKTTLQKVRELGKTCYTTPEWSDVDTLADLEEFIARPPEDVRTAKIQNRIRAALQGAVRSGAEAPARANS
jgi:uncharacterized protein